MDAAESEQPDRPHCKSTIDNTFELLKEKYESIESQIEDMLHHKSSQKQIKKIKNIDFLELESKSLSKNNTVGKSRKGSKGANYKNWNLLHRVEQEENQQKPEEADKVIVHEVEEPAPKIVHKSIDTTSTRSDSMPISKMMKDALSTEERIKRQCQQ